MHPSQSGSAKQELQPRTHHPWWIWITLSCVGLTLPSCLTWTFSGNTVTHNVLSFSPSQTSEKKRPTLTFTFMEYIVDGNALNKNLKQIPIQISPPLKVKARWERVDLLQLTPQEDLRPATRYTLTLPTRHWPKLIGPHRFSFVSRPLKLQFVKPQKTVGPSPTFSLQWNMPVAKEETIRGCNLYPQHPQGYKKQGPSKVTPTIKLRIEVTRSGTSHKLTPFKKLQEGAKYTLRCNGIRPTHGTEPLAQDVEQTFQVEPPFQVVEYSPKGNKEIPNSFYLNLKFSTPIKLQNVERHLSVQHTQTKQNIKVQDGSLSYTGKSYDVKLDLKPKTHYRIKLSPKLKSRRGTPLAKPFSFTLQTGWGKPYLVAERGTYVLEPHKPGYAVWNKNIETFGVSCVKVPLQKATSAIESPGTAFAGLTGNKPLWKSLGMKPISTVVSIQKSIPRWKRSQVHLAKACGAKKAHGLYLVTFDLPTSNDGSRGEIHNGSYNNPYDENTTQPPHKVMVNVTDLGLHLKVGTSSGLVWVTSMKTGLPVKGARVVLYSTKGQPLFQGKTNREGILRTPGVVKMLQRWPDLQSTRKILVRVQHGQDFAVLNSDWSNGIQMWNFGIQAKYRKNEPQVRAFIQSDRGLYRPGETVHFQGWIRSLKRGQLPHLPKQRGIQVLVQDAKSEEIFTKKLRLNSFGGFHFKLSLPKNAPVGDYWVQAKTGTAIFREKFVVQDFKKVSMELRLPAPAWVTQGHKFNMKLQARYLHGSWVSGAKVYWQVARRVRRLNFPKFSGYAFHDNASQGWDTRWRSSRYSETELKRVTTHEAKTDSKGVSQLSFRDESTSLETKLYDYIIQATLTNAQNQTISKTVVVPSHPSSAYVGLHVQETIQAVGMPFAVSMIALSPDGKRIAKRGTLQILRWREKCETIQQTYSRSRVIGTRSLLGAPSRRYCTKSYQRVFTQRVNIPATGTGIFRYKPKKPGAYVFRLYGGGSTASGNIWVLGKGEAFWSGDESVRMSLVASKAKYQPGDTIKLIPKVSMGPVTALVTIERDGVIESFTRRLPSTGEGIQLRAKASYAPNVYVSVVLVQGRRGKGDKLRPSYSIGMLNLKVATTRQRLNVRIHIPKRTYKPGQRVRGYISVTAQGKPVKSDVSLSVADEGLLQIIAYPTPDPMPHFYKPWGLGVDNANNWNRIALDKDVETIKSETNVGGKDDNADESMSLRRVRSKFVNSAYWAPSLRTQRNGRAYFSFRAPDNLTAFRMMAVAADQRNRFGSGERRLTVRLPIALKPSLPQFLVQGDTVQLGAAVHNMTSSSGWATVTISGKGIRLLRRSKRIRLTERGTHEAMFRAKVLNVDQALVTIRVRFRGKQDSFRKKIPVDPMLDDERTLVLRKTLKNKGTHVLLQWPRDVILSRSQLHVTVDRSGMGRLGESLRYLVTYPYGCLEQTLSKFVPLVMVKDLTQSLSLKTLNKLKISTFVKAGIKKVIRHQDETGHFKYWPSASKPTPWLTPLAMFGLYRAYKAGMSVPSSALVRGRKALQRWAEQQKHDATGHTMANIAMAAYVLAAMGHPDGELHKRLWVQRKRLPLFGQAFLLRAMEYTHSKSKQQKLLMKELLHELQVKQGVGVIRPCQHSRLRPCETSSMFMSSATRTQAIVLGALLQVQPQHKLIPQLVKTLLQVQRNGRWRNTQENLFALLALSAYARHVDKGASWVSFQRGRWQKSRRVTGAKVQQFQVSLRNLRQGRLRIQVKGRANLQVMLSTARPLHAPQPLTHGLSLQRWYLDPKTKQPLQRFHAGMKVLVRLEATTRQTQHYVAMVDPLPGGWMAIHPKFATSQRDLHSSMTQSKTWNHQEYRTNRVQIFADTMKAGRHVFEYGARIPFAGRFTAKPARIEAMYQPERWGRTAALTLDVLP